MLDKIVNITSNFRYKSGGSAPGFEKFLNESGAVRSNLHDSILFSPAAYFLSKINWQLKDISNPSKEKFLLDFIIEEIEFQTEIDTAKFNSELWQRYNIISEVETSSAKFKTLIKLSTFKNTIDISESIDLFNLDGLRTLFERVLKNKFMQAVNDVEVERDLTDGIRYNLVKEFDFINSALFILVEKLGNKKLVVPHLPVEQNTDHINIEKITVVNGR